MGGSSEVPVTDMSRYLTSLRERAEPKPGDPLVLDLDTEDAGEILGALSSETAREILLALHEDPATLSEVAEAVDTSRQNAQYHMKKLKAVDAVQVVETLYSEKGREMKVYAPSGDPLIIVSAEDGTGTRLRDAISGMLGLILAIGVVSAAVQLVAEFSFEWAPSGETPNLEQGTSNGEVVGEQFASTGQMLWEAYPGLVVFLCALLAIGVVVGFRYARDSHSLQTA